MSENDLFGAADAPESMTRPLAVRMRPRTLDEVIGQTQVLGQGSPLRRQSGQQRQSHRAELRNPVRPSRRRQNHARHHRGRPIRPRV